MPQGRRCARRSASLLTSPLRIEAGSQQRGAGTRGFGSPILVLGNGLSRKSDRVLKRTLRGFPACRKTGPASTPGNTKCIAPGGNIARILADANRGPSPGLTPGYHRSVSDAIDPAWISPERFSEYLEAADGDDELASRLYEWNVSASSALFELIAHFEVLWRNHIVHEIDRAGINLAMPPGSPWILDADSVTEVITRLKKRGQPATAGRIYAGLTFGFWKTMFFTASDELWSHSLGNVFRHTRADRHVVSEYLESVNQLRNRIAHHGSLLDHDLIAEAQKLFRLTSWLDPKAETWLRKLDRTGPLAAARPVTAKRDAVVVPGPEAWQLYDAMKQPAYVFPAGRSVRVVDHLAFYADGEIKTLVPRIIKWYDAVDWNRVNAKRLSKTGDTHDATLARVIHASLDKGWKISTYQVFLLSGRTDSDTLNLGGSIAHNRSGRGSAFVKSHRYVPLGALRSARETGDIAF